MASVNKILSKPQLSNIIKNGAFGRSFHNSSNFLASSTSSGKQDICTEGKAKKMDIACKVALVSGGTSGIGLAAATQLLCAGARNVVITGPNACQGKEAATFLNNTYGMGKAIYINANVNCMGQFEDAFKNAKEMYKRIDIVVNAAGICDGPHWEREIITNVIGTIRGTLLAYRYVGKQGSGKGGCVVNVAGVNGLDPLPAAPTLCASQHAIVGLTRSFGSSIHKNKSGVRVVCLCPGFTQTSFIKNVVQRGMTDELGKQLEKAVKKAKKQGPDPCGHAIAHLINYAKNGTVWMCEASRLFVLNMPKRKTYATLVAQYL